MGVAPPARILHVADDYPYLGFRPKGPRGFARGVIARQVAALAGHHAARGNVVHVITSDLGERGTWALTDAAGVRVHRLPPGRASFERAIERVRPDVVHLHEGRLARRALGVSRGPTVVSHWGEGGIPLGVDLRPWIAAGQRRRPSEDSRMIFHAGDNTHATLASLPSGALADFALTAIGPEADAVPDAEVILGDAPEGVFAALASEHEFYFSACSMDPHLAGARAAGMRVMASAAQFSSLGEAVPGSRARDPRVPDPATHSWEAVVAHVQGLYNAACELHHLYP